MKFSITLKLKTNKKHFSKEFRHSVFYTDCEIHTHLAHRFQFIRCVVSSADHRGFDLEPPVVHALAGVIGHHRKSHLVQSLGHFWS